MYPVSFTPFRISSQKQMVFCLEPSCYKKRQKSPNQATGLGNRGPLKVLNGTKLIPNDKQGHSCSIRINLVSFRTFRCHLFPKPVACFGFFYCLLQQDSSNISQKRSIEGRSILFNHFIDMRTTANLSISCRKNVFLHEMDKLTVVLMSIK